jgi:hypothetical protein
MASNDRSVARIDANADIEFEARTVASVRGFVSLSWIELAKFFQSDGFRTANCAWLGGVNSQSRVHPLQQENKDKGPWLGIGSPL